MIEAEMQRVPNEKVRCIAVENLERIAKGERDFRF